MMENGRDNDDRRGFPRLVGDFGVRMIDVHLKPLEAFPSKLPCYETHFVSTNATGRNISEGGFAFESEKNPEVRSILGLELALPQYAKAYAVGLNPSPYYELEDFRGMGQVVWSAPQGTKYLVGVRFIDVNQPRSVALRKLVAFHSAQHLSRGFIRRGISDSLTENSR